MNVLQSNPKHTVGIVNGTNPISDYIGKYNPVLLKEWLELVIENFGSEPVYLSSHKSIDPDNSAHILSVSDEYCDEVQVCVTGLEHDIKLKGY